MISDDIFTCNTISVLGILYCGEKAEIEHALNIAAEEGEWHREKKENV